MMFMGTEITEADLTNNVWNKYLFVSEVMIGKWFTRPWNLARYIKKSLKWSLQRITRGFSDGDIWWMQAYLQMLLPDMLQYLKDHRMGSPVCLNRTDKPEDDSCHEEWDKVLNQMIFLWRESYEYSSSQKNPCEEAYSELLNKYFDKYEDPGVGLAMMPSDPKYKKIWDKYKQEEEIIILYRAECKDKALDMLKEYFYCLWD